MHLEFKGASKGAPRITIRGRGRDVLAVVALLVLVHAAALADLDAQRVALVVTSMLLTNCLLSVSGRQ